MSFSVWVTKMLQRIEIAKTLAEFLAITQIRTCLKVSLKTLLEREIIK